jgi:hypothetical protein
MYDTPTDSAVAAHERTEERPAAGEKMMKSNL